MFIFTSLVPGTEKFDDFVLDPASRRPPVSPVFTLHRYNINMVKRSNNKIERRKSLEKNDCSEAVREKKEKLLVSRPSSHMR